MASCTSRIFLTLAVPIFGFLTILFLKRKKLKSFELNNLTNSQSKTDTILTSPTETPPNCSTIVESTQTREMQLKETESNSTSLCNGVVNYPTENCKESGIVSKTNGTYTTTGTSTTNGKSSTTNGKSSTTNGTSSTINGTSSTINGTSSTANGTSSTANGTSSTANGLTGSNQANGHCRASYAAAVKINKNVNGIAPVKTKPKDNNTINMKPAKADKNVNQNGLRKQTARTEHNGESLSTNNVSECDICPALNKPNGVSVSTSNNVNQINKYKCKKKSKGKMPEKSDTCSTEQTSNGCNKDNNVLVETDNKSILSNCFSNLTVQDTSAQEIVSVTKSGENNLNSCPKNSTPEHSTSSANSVSDTQTITINDMQNSHSENIQVAEDAAAAKECDIVNQALSPENHCVTPESGRSSETLSETAETLQVDINGHLTFSDDCIAMGGQDMLPSPETAYCDSLGSNDSGRGGSELQFGFDSQPYSMTYEFDLPADHCGYLIGKKGSHVNYIKEKTNAMIHVRNSLSPCNADKKVVSIIAGDEASINEALKLIRKRFPLSQYPEVTLERSDRVLICPPTLKLALPEGVEFQVVLSATVNAAHFFVQLPTHPSYHALPPFTLSMTSLYTHCHAPVVTAPTIGNIVVAPVGDGWFRAEIMEVFTEDSSCRLKYLDYGGYQIVPTSTLRQINFEFMQMPFQAIECYLANVTCHEELGWTEESKLAFENLAQGQILSAYVAGVAEDGVPCLHLYKVTGATNTFVNQALVDNGYAKWLTYEQQ